MGNFHLMAKPTGPACNLSCTYCFYLEKKNLFGPGTTVMSDQVLAAYTRKYIRSQDGPTVEFTWQGGEPTLAGLDFYRRAIQHQMQHNQNQQISNSLQTNGTLINEEWCRFLAKHNFLVGLSVDGPAELHDHFRKDTAGKPTFHKVERTIRLLKRYRVEFNVLTTVNDTNSREPQKLYDFYKRAGVQFVQLIPIVERTAGEQSSALGLNLASPEDTQHDTQVTNWSVKPEPYADFLITMFDQWVRNDIGRIFIMNFEWALSAVIHGVSGTCHHAERCGTAGVIEHNGDIYSCDHFVYPAYRIGNILDDDPSMLFNSQAQLAFGNEKKNGLTDECRNCEVLHLCNGGCPKHRFVSGQNYLCSAYRRFFNHIIPYAESARKLIKQGRPLTELMNIAEAIR
ncbi:MAG: anaerobic sulfatase maturase [Anaerolineae bacterium]|nr:anaerobic sulfatase maturase [Anaerolineae bacterium]